jgi:hypothetical protein
VGVHGFAPLFGLSAAFAPAASVIVTFDSMKLIGRRRFQATLTRPYHFLDFRSASETMARRAGPRREQVVVFVR